MFPVKCSGQSIIFAVQIMWCTAVEPAIIVYYIHFLYKLQVLEVLAVIIVQYSYAKSASESVVRDVVYWAAQWHVNNRGYV